jgi:tRNA(Ile)-lysidine synthase
MRGLQPLLSLSGYAGVAQLVRACGSYPQGPGFKSLHRHHIQGNRQRGTGPLPVLITAATRQRPRIQRFAALSSMIRRLARAIPALWGPSDRIAVAVSGGADSVALLCLLQELAGSAPWTLAGVIHVHHGLRGAEADADASFCRELAMQHALPFELVSVDVTAERSRTRHSLEAAARTLRYQSFAAAAERLGATVVATGHTLDDQAETVLLRLFRGATSRGVSAIRPRRGIYARPLLDCRRQELRQYLGARGQRWREDLSNADDRVPRNRLRRDVMPPIEQAWPGAVEALARFAAAAAADEQLLSRLAADVARDVIRIGSGGVELVRAPFAALPVAVARRLIRDAIEAAGGTPSFGDVEIVRRLVGPGRSGRQGSLRGLSARVDEAVVRVSAPAAADVVAPFSYQLNVPGLVRIDETGGVVRASLFEGSDRPPLSAGWEAIAAVQMSSVALPLTVRSRAPGDRFTPLGGPGRRLLQDLLVDRKVPRSERAALPVVVDADGHIVWVAGVAVADRCRVQSGESSMLILEVKKGIQ